MPIPRMPRAAAALASVMIASGSLLWLSAGIAAAQEPQPEIQPIQPLYTPKPEPNPRELTLPPAQTSPEDQKLLDRLRAINTRSLSRQEREEVDYLIIRRPTIDLEVNFESNSAEISSKIVPILRELGRALANPELRGSVFLIGGHTDGNGGAAYNQRLSERRAEAVKRFLMENFGVESKRLVTAGYGKEQLKDKDNPFAPSNRRVQIVNLGERK